MAPQEDFQWVTWFQLRFCLRIVSILALVYDDVNMTWRLFFLSSTRNKNTGQVLIFRSGGNSPRGWKTARWQRRVTKGEKTLLRSWMNHIPSDVSGSRFAKTWYHFRGCPELSDLAAAEMEGRWVFFFFFFSGGSRYPVMNERFSCTQQDKVIELDFQLWISWIWAAQQDSTRL